MWILLLLPAENVILSNLLDWAESFFISKTGIMIAPLCRITLEVRVDISELFVPSKTVVVLAAKSCLTPCNPMDCSLSGSSVHDVLRQEYWSGMAAISFSRGSSRPGDQTPVSQVGRGILYHWATREAPRTQQGSLNISCTLHYSHHGHHHPSVSFFTAWGTFSSACPSVIDTGKPLAAFSSQIIRVSTMCQALT